MLLDFSVDWQWIIGSTNVSPHVETWELTREQPDMGTPAWWRGKLVLRPVVGRDLNLDPLTNLLWKQGTACNLTVGGSPVFTGSLLLAYYDDWSTAPRLELEVGDVLAAANHRQVIPFGEYDAQSLLATLGIPGLAPAGDAVEISTDLTSPVKVLQELTWVAGLKAGMPVTLFTRPNGQADYVSPQIGISLTRTLEQVADFTRQRPALEIPGSVIASASLTYSVQPLAPRKRGGESPAVIIAKQEDTTTITHLDSLGRINKELVYKNGALDGHAYYEYYVDDKQYVINKFTRVKQQTGRQTFRYVDYERTREEGKRVQGQSNDAFVRGQSTAQKTTIISWPGWRFISGANDRLFLAYFIDEYSILGRAAIPASPPGQASIQYILRLVRRAKGTTQDSDTLSEATSILPAFSEVLPNQQIQFPDWVQRFWKPDKPERVTDTLSEEVGVAGFTGPPVYVTVPWLSVSVQEGQQLGSLRQRIRSALRAAASWMAVEIAGRAFARRVKMPPPTEWLSNPRPWVLARIGNEVLWLVGETLRGTSQGVEFEATGILAGRPSTIPPGEFPPGMIPAFIPLITVVPTRFPQVGIGCVMGAGEMELIQGDPWLGLAVEIEHDVSDPVGPVMVGIGRMGIPAVGLGFAAGATHEITSEDDGEGLTLEAEDGDISDGVIVYDAEASSCYAVETQGDYYYIDLYVDSTSLTWERPLRIRVIYKATGSGQINFYTFVGTTYYQFDSFSVSATTGYTTIDLFIPVHREPFDGIDVEVYEYSGKIRLDAIQLAPSTGNWPPLNPCPD